MSKIIALRLPNAASLVTWNKIFAPHLADKAGFFCKARIGYDANWQFVKAEVAKPGQALGVFEDEKPVILPQTNFFAMSEKIPKADWQLLLNECFSEALKEDRTTTLPMIRQAIHNFSRILRGDCEIVDGEIVTKKSTPGLIAGRMNAAKATEDLVKAQAAEIEALKAQLAAKV
jgi:hypothetical protein